MLNAIFFATCYSIIINFPRYGKLWHMDLLIFYSSFSLISLSSSPSAIQYSPTNFLSTITDLLHQFFFPFLFALSSLFYLRVTYRRGSSCGFVISDCDQRGRKSLGCGFVNSDCDWRGSLGCGSLFYLESLIHYSLFSESPIRCSISEGFIESFYIYYVQVSFPSSP